VRLAKVPLKLDEVDMAILKALTRNGRLSFRQIASLAGVSAPTVESRLRKMMDSGIIKRIAPILDVDRVEAGVAALLMLRVEPSKLDSVVKKLMPLDEVRNIFVTTGQANMIVRVATRSNRLLQDFLGQKLAPLGVEVLSSEIIIRTAKDEQGIALDGEMAVALVCDYCGGEISGRPFTLNVRGGKRFFCCRTCLSAYREKHARRLSAPTEAKGVA
jgi:Lrp/AsnC family transcriptional regulator for asnA, asnC and gidA